MAETYMDKTVVI